MKRKLYLLSLFIKLIVRCKSLGVDYDSWINRPFVLLHCIGVNKTVSNFGIITVKYLSMQFNISPGECARQYLCHSRGQETCLDSSVSDIRTLHNGKWQSIKISSLCNVAEKPRIVISQHLFFPRSITENVHLIIKDFLSCGCRYYVIGKWRFEVIIQC